MAHGFKEIKQGSGSPNVKSCKVQVKSGREGKGIGSRRMFSTQFKLQVLDSYRQDADCRGNQRATARKYGIHRRQIQKWLQMESSLRCSASESGEVALNLAGRSRQRDGTCNAGCLTAEPERPDSTPNSNSEGASSGTGDDDEEEEELNVDKISDSEDDASSGESVFEQEQALDFTCAALSRRRFYSLDFKLEVLHAFRYDSSCCGNQRATALKFGVHRRQVEKWLNQEEMLRSEYATRPKDYDYDVALSFAAPPPPTASPCLDLSRKRKADDVAAPEERKKFYLDLDVDVEKPTSVQETALCLVKPPSLPPPHCEVTSSLDLVYRPQCSTSPCNYWTCCADPQLHPQPQSFYDCWSTGYSCPYACITSRLHHDAVYYKQAVKDINLYAPLYS